MKNLALCCIAAVAFCRPAIGQLVLHPGDTWTYQFNALPLTGSVPVFGANPNGSFEFTVNSASFESGDVLRYELFENDPSETPLSSGALNAAPPFTVSCQADGAWQDLQGAIRLTMLSGSVTVDSLTVQAIVSGPSLSRYDVHSSTFTPVPEPAPASLLALGAGCFAMLRRLQGKGRVAASGHSAARSRAP